ncbi:MAG: hypothetical protein HRT35_23995 [Algicola sp.]|nr:hypothetical protein [Algicola sp.]
MTTQNTPTNRVFDHIIIIMMENQYCGDVLNNQTMLDIANAGMLIPHSYGVMHPSYTNYLTSISGQLCNNLTDDFLTGLIQPTICDRIMAATAPTTLTWKAYIEDLNNSDEFRYIERHNPFASFLTLSTMAPPCIVDYTTLQEDIDNNNLPNYSWITPNGYNDGHYNFPNNSNPNKLTETELSELRVQQTALWLSDLLTNWGLINNSKNTATASTFVTGRS